MLQPTNRYLRWQDTLCSPDFIGAGCNAGTPACVAQSGREADQRFAAIALLPKQVRDRLSSPAIANTFVTCCIFCLLLVVEMCQEMEHH